MKKAIYLHLNYVSISICNDMEWLNSLFFEHSALQAVVVMAIIIAVGLGLGKIRLWGISLGVTCVFFRRYFGGTFGFFHQSRYADIRRKFRFGSFCL